MAKKRKTKNKVREVCPVCKHMKIKGSPCRSQHCLSSRIMAPSEVRKWRILVAPAATAMVLANSVLEEKAKTDPKCVPFCKRIIKWHLEVNNTVVSALDAKQQFVNGQKLWLRDLIVSLLPPEAKYDITFLCEVITMLVQDSIEYLHETYDKNSPDVSFSKGELSKPWNFLEGACQRLLEYFDPEGEGRDGSFEKYQVMRSEIWGESLNPTKEPELRFYEAGNRFMVAAHSKGEARDIVRRETGIVRIEIKWCDPRTKIEVDIPGVKSYGDLSQVVKVGELIPLRWK